MERVIIAGVALLLLCPTAMSQEAGEETAAEPASPEAPESSEAATDEQKTAEGGPKTMSGMSILGNEEAPKSLVIIPWKSSELGENISLSNTLNDRAQPVDKDVFLRELSFYEIRSGK